MDFEKTKAGVIEILKPLSFSAEEVELYSTAMATHEVDSSIIASKWVPAFSPSVSGLIFKQAAEP